MKSPVSGTGNYAVFFIDAGGANAHCMPLAWDTFGADNYRVDVNCLDNNQGNPLNSDFSLLVLDCSAPAANNPNLAFAYSFVSGNLTIPVQCTNLDGNSVHAMFNVLSTFPDASPPAFTPCAR